MRNKILSIALSAAALMATTSCSDYLETSSVSTADGNFVFSNMTTARAAMDGAYSSWHGCISAQIFGDGLFYALDIAGSDIMRHPEAFDKQLPRHEPESFYVGGSSSVLAGYNPVTYGKEAPSSAYAQIYSVVGITNAIIMAIQQMDNYQEMISSDHASDLSNLYGEAVCLRATCYRELIKYYGDVPYPNMKTGKANGLASRDSIYDDMIAELELVAPKMYAVKADEKNHFSSTYAYALAGRMALEAAGYQIRRTDGSVRYVDGKGTAIQLESMGTDHDNATYARRGDWKALYAKAKTNFQAALANKGAAKFNENDYTEFFTQLHGDDNSYADESIYEEPFTQGASGNDPRSYSLGRPNTGGSSNDYPCKAYGQGRINPAFYYGMFDPKDIRRDISCTVTGNNKGYEKLIPFTPGSQANGGGIACNKFDEGRQVTVWTKNQRRSGINAPYMRMSEIYLGLAEVAAVEGNRAEVIANLSKTRNRAFRGNGNVEAFLAQEGDLLEAVIDERGFEFAGEGDRRWTLIRTGLIGKKIKAIKQLSTDMVKDLDKQGYHRFENGNVISKYIWTKMVDPKSAEFGLKSRLTGVCPADQEENPVLYPGWRGQHDWETVDGFTKYASDPKSNLAIKGLFKQLSDAEIAALEADGYKKTNWGIDLVNNEKEYADYIFRDWDFNTAPIYVFPFTLNARNTGNFKNGYGFSNGTEY